MIEIGADSFGIRSFFCVIGNFVNGSCRFFAKKLDSCVISVDFFIIVVIILYVGIFFDTPINKIRLELL